MNVSSRTPEGLPSECPVCGAITAVEFSEPTGDAVCPICGSLIWKAADVQRRVSAIVEEHLGASPGKVNHATSLVELGADSLDAVELVMELEEELDVNISEEVASECETIGDIVRAILKASDR